MQNKEAGIDLRIPVTGRNQGVADERTEQLLRIFSEVEAHESSMTPERFSELLQQAALACGFADNAEACESLIGSALFGLQRKGGTSCSGNDDTGTPVRPPVTS